jgi:hypothetical protein
LGIISCLNIAPICLAPMHINQEKAFGSVTLARIFHELLSRDRKDGWATGQPQGVGPEAYLIGTSQGSTSEDAREDNHIRGRSRRFMKYPG